MSTKTTPTRHRGISTKPRVTRSQAGAAACPTDESLNLVGVEDAWGEFLEIDPSRVVQLDSSAEMLALPDREPSVLRVLHDAETLPFRQASSVRSWRSCATVSWV